MSKFIKVFLLSGIILSAISCQDFLIESKITEIRQIQLSDLINDIIALKPRVKSVMCRYKEAYSKTNLPTKDILTIISVISNKELIIISEINYQVNSARRSNVASLSVREFDYIIDTLTKFKRQIINFIVVYSELVTELETNTIY